MTDEQPPERPERRRPRGRLRAMVGKDLRTLWSSPIPWVVGALLHVLLAVLFLSQVEARRQAALQPLFPIAGFLLVTFVPVVAMRSVADEARTGTLDLLEAVPVPAPVVAAGKWLATWLSCLFVLAPAAVHAVLLEWLGEPDGGPIVAGYVGLALLAAALSGLGVLASALTSSQPVAAVVAFAAGLVLWFAHVGSDSVLTGPLLAHLSVSERLRSFASGVFDTADLTYFLVLTAASLVVAATRLDLRRLR